MNTILRSFRAATLMGAAASMLAFAPGAKAQNDNTWPYARTGRSPVLAVVGDIACQPGEATPQGESNHELCINPKSPYSITSLWQSQEATANQIEAMKPDLVAITGDLQYQVGQYTDFRDSYDLTYGAFKFITRPSPGNHEFYDEHSQTGVAGYGYFSYFNGFQVDSSGNPLMTTIAEPCPSTQPDPAACNNPGETVPNPQPIPRSDGQAGHFEQSGGVATTLPAGAPVGVGDGWYSYNLGGWHLISLNIECSTQPGGCSNTGAWFAAELAWLQNDLASNHSACTAAYWHQPTFSATNGITPEGVTAQAFWNLLYRYHADLVLNGHDHLYARYQPLDPSGNYDKANGIREIIVGTGGETLDPIVNVTVTAAQAAASAGSANPLTETNMEDPSGNVSFNALHLEAYTGFYWGVMALTLNQGSYAWDFKSALAGPPTLPNGSTLPAPKANGGYSDTGAGTCHNSQNSQGNQQ